MIPKLIQKRGAQHLAEEEAAEILSGDSPLEPPRSVVELIPASVARAHNVFPIKLEGRVLHVATTNPNDLLLRDKLSFIVNKDIKLVEYPRASILRAIRNHYPETRSESVAGLACEVTTSDRYDEVFSKSRGAFGDYGRGDSDHELDLDDSRDAETEQEIRRQADERTRQHLAALKEMGVDLTAFLTQGRADRVIELRGGGKGVAPHLHLDNADGDKPG